MFLKRDQCSLLSYLTSSNSLNSCQNHLKLNGWELAHLFSATNKNCLVKFITF